MGPDVAQRLDNYVFRNYPPEVVRKYVADNDLHDSYREWATAQAATRSQLYEEIKKTMSAENKILKQMWEMPIVPWPTASTSPEETRVIPTRRERNVNECHLCFQPLEERIERKFPTEEIDFVYTCGTLVRQVTKPKEKDEHGEVIKPARIETQVVKIGSDCILAKS